MIDPIAAGALIARECCAQGRHGDLVVTFTVISAVDVDVERRQLRNHLRLQIAEL